MLPNAEPINPPSFSGRCMHLGVRNGQKCTRLILGQIGGFTERCEYYRPRLLDSNQQTVFTTHSNDSRRSALWSRFRKMTGGSEDDSTRSSKMSGFSPTDENGQVLQVLRNTLRSGRLVTAKHKTTLCYLSFFHNQWSVTKS